MSKFFLGDEYHQTLRFFSKEVNMFLKDNKAPHKLIEKLIKEEMKKRGISVTVEVPLKDRIKDFIKNNNIITTTIAKEKNLIKQSVELQNMVMLLIAEGFKIEKLTIRRPFVYYHGISRDEAIRRTRKERYNGPNVTYGNRGGY
jgi:hypothetical protein